MLLQDQIAFSMQSLFLVFNQNRHGIEKWCPDLVTVADHPVDTANQAVGLEWTAAGGEASGGDTAKDPLIHGQVLHATTNRGAIENLLSDRLVRIKTGQILGGIGIHQRSEPGQ